MVSFVYPAASPSYEKLFVQQIQDQLANRTFTFAFLNADLGI